MRLMKKLLFWLTASILILPGSLAHGQSPEANVLISPALTRATAKAGETLKVNISVSNPTANSLDLSVKANDFISTPEAGGEPQILADGVNEKYGLSGWFAGSESFRLASGKSKDYQAVFTVPKDAADRTYFAAIRFTPAGKPDNSGSMTSVASMVFIDVGSPVSKPEITDLMFDEDAGDNGRYTVAVKNNGEGLFSGSLKLEVKQDDGTLIETLDPEKPGSVLPESTRIYNFQPKKALPDKVIKVTASLTDQARKQVSREITLNRGPASDASTAKPAEQKSGLLPVMVGAFVVLMTLTTALVMKRRKKSLSATSPAAVSFAPQTTQSQDENPKAPQ